MVTACGEAAHPDVEVAVRKALLEWAAARTRKAFMHGPLDVVRSVTPPDYLDRWLTGHPPERLVEEDRALEAMVDWSRRSGPELVELLSGTVLSQRRTVPLGDLPTSTPDDVHDHVVGALADAGHDVLVSIHPSRDGEVVAVKALVPGLEVETMSYGRIGERGVRRLLERGSDLVCVGDRPEGSGWAAVALTEQACERLGGPAWFDLAARDRVVGPLYPLYREPGRHVVAALASMS
jgi:ribosomal protein S12 methylthiotransferase accessory factor